MRPVSEMDIIQIDVTNICNRTCSNCTRLCGHYPADKTYFMDIKYYEVALKSLDKFPGMIGMIGGEPTLHPCFPELCEILKKYIPEKERRGLWSNAGRSFLQYENLIRDTFGFLNINDHISNDILHTPILVSSQDMIDSGQISEEQWLEYTDNCWVQTTWSATITPHGAYFCEVAGMLDSLFDGNIGWDITNTLEWWKKPVVDYSGQIAWACKKCGCQLPLRPRRSSESIDDVSESNLKHLVLLKSPKIIKGQFCLYSSGLDTKQVRNIAWYWNKKNYLGRLKSLVSNFFRP